MGIIILFLVACVFDLILELLGFGIIHVIETVCRAFGWNSSWFYKVLGNIFCIRTVILVILLDLPWLWTQNWKIAVPCEIVLVVLFFSIGPAWRRFERWSYECEARRNGGRTDCGE